jgi:uncharacterized membrane protein YwaF
MEFVTFPISFLCGYYPFIEARATFTEYWMLFILLHLALSGMANVISVTFRSKHKSLVASCSLVLCWGFGGIQPPLQTIRDRLGTFGYAVNCMSPFKWGYEIQMLSELGT